MDRPRAAGEQATDALHHDPDIEKILREIRQVFIDELEDCFGFKVIIADTTHGAINLSLTNQPSTIFPMVMDWISGMEPHKMLSAIHAALYDKCLGIAAFDVSQTFGKNALGNIKVMGPWTKVEFLQNLIVFLNEKKAVQRLITWTS